MIVDEMSSQDAAFGTENEKKEDLFKFDEPKETSPDSQSKEESVSDTSTEESSTDEDGASLDGQKVPYTRFKKILDESKETASRVQFLEEELEKIRDQKDESQKDVEPDEAWKKLYGDNDVAREAFKIQIRRDNEISERAVEQALERIQQREQIELESLSENEEIIDGNLDSLQEKIGKKLTSKQEEDILSIVDEFSPTGNDGKYITLFPFDKAYEIYSLRNNSKQQPRRQARESIADLTGRSSDGEVESNGSSFQAKNWDSWRNEVEG